MFADCLSRYWNVNILCFFCISLSKRIFKTPLYFSFSQHNCQNTFFTLTPLTISQVFSQEGLFLTMEEGLTKYILTFYGQKKCSRVKVFLYKYLNHLKLWINAQSVSDGIGTDLIYFFSAPASLHCKKSVSNFPSPAGNSLIKLSLGGNNLIIPVQGEYGQWHPGWERENR